MSGTAGPAPVCLVTFADDIAAGARCLAAYLEAHGFPVRLLFLNRYDGLPRSIPAADLACAARAVAGWEAPIVGLSVRSFYAGAARDFTAQLRLLAPASRIVWGGVHPTIAPEECIEWADAVCLGEGEESFLELVTRLAGHGVPGTVEGIWQRRGDQVERTPFRPPLADLDRVPPIRYGGGNAFLVERGVCRLHDGLPSGGFSRFGARKYGILTSRGCPGSCSYCVNSFLRHRYPPGCAVRRRSPGHVLQELRAVRDLADVIDFQDDDFLADRAWVEEFLPRYREEIGRPFLCFAMPVRARDAGYLALLRRAGLISLATGIQSGSPRTQKLYRRPFRRGDFIDIARAARKLRILPHFDVILNNPLETEGDLRKTLELLLDLDRPFRLNLFSLAFYPRYDLTIEAVRRGVISGPDCGYSRYLDERGSYASDSHLNNLIYLSQFALPPRRLLRRLAGLRGRGAVRLSRFLVRLAQHTAGSPVAYLALLTARNPRLPLAVARRRLGRLLRG